MTDQAELRAWQPIATAPLDTPILVTDGKNVAAAEMYAISEYRYINPHCVSSYEWEWDAINEHGLTHWMPLPNPPEPSHD